MKLLYIPFVIVLLLFSACEPSVESDKYVYLSDVFEYVYAPGQHAALALKTDTQYLTGNPAMHNQWLYLGGFGGYVVAGFPKDVPNQEGVDFEVYALSGAGPEPAVVYVMEDENKDGKPNETWFELKGSLYSESQRNFAITYYKADSVNADIRWKDNAGNTGTLKSGFGSAYSSAWWWPETAADSITFTGTRLPDVYVNSPVNGNPFWSVPESRIPWGYAENMSGNDYNAENFSNMLDISNAVDAAGNAVSLSSIRFIKIQSAVFQQAGVTNEVSAEIRGARGVL